MIIPKTEPEILSLCELLISLIAYEDTPVPESLDLESQAHLAKMGKLEKIRFLRELTVELEEQNASIPKVRLAYLPYDDEYVLVSKKSLLVTGMSLDVIAKGLAEKLRVPVCVLHGQTVQIVARKIHELSDDCINDLVLQIVSQATTARDFNVIMVDPTSA